MLDKQLLKVGGVSAILGAVLTQLAGIIHPTEQITIFNPAIHLGQVAMNGYWRLDYFLFVLGAILLAIGLIAISHLLEETGTKAWAKIALGVGLMSITFSLVFFALDGFATKIVALSLVNSGGDAMGVWASSIIEAIGRVCYGMWTFFVFGVTPFLFSAAVMKNKNNNFNKFLWIIPTIGGILGIVTGALNMFNDFSLSYLPTFYIAVLLFNIWMVWMGIKMWKMAKTI